MGLCQAPLGVSGGLTLVTLPQLLAAKHVPVPVIAGVETWALVPLFCAFLISPILDWRFSRRCYAIVMAVLTAAFIFISYLTLDNILLLSLLNFLNGASITLYVAAIGGWTGSIVAPAEKAALGARDDGGQYRVGRLHCDGRHLASAASALCRRRCDPGHPLRPSRWRYSHSCRWSGPDKKTGQL